MSLFSLNNKFLIIKQGRGASFVVIEFSNLALIRGGVGVFKKSILHDTNVNQEYIKKGRKLSFKEYIKKGRKLSFT